LIPYWLLFGYFAFGALMSNSSATGRQPSLVPLLVGTLLIAVMVGLRYKVGADWITYQFLFLYAGHADLWRVLQIGDPGYQFINWIVQRVGEDVWLVNLIGAVIFAWGLQRFARVQTDPWLALVVAIPYLVVVVAMGYSRQAIAIGVVMAGLASLQRGTSLPRFAVYVAVAALFHRTAVVVLPVVVFASDRNRFLNFLVGIAASVLLYDLFLSDSVDKFVSNYIKAEYNSQGAAIRVVMSLVPATIYLLSMKRFRFLPRDEKIWRNFSLVAWALLVLLLLLPSSTAVDRLALYVIPLQIAILSRLPRAFDSPTRLRAAVIGYSALVLFVWLNFAAHAKYWVPYQLYPLA
jgi:hypothetical protein